MVNDEVNNKAINIEIKVAQYSAKSILKAMKKIIEDADEKSQQLADYISEKRKTNSRKLKDMVKKGQLENIYKQNENKFIAFKDYADRRKINWGGLLEIKIQDFILTIQTTQKKWIMKTVKGWMIYFNVLLDDKKFNNETFKEIA